MRKLFWFLFYIVTLGIFSISVKHGDGTKVRLTGWPELIGLAK